MTTFERFEGDLPMLLEELAPPRRPDYLDSVFGQTVGTRQRPAWTFLERWLPMSAVTSTAASPPRFPLRTVVVAILALLAIVLAGILVVGALRADVPSAYGVAGNGQIAYTSGNDVFLVDPTTGSSTPLVSGPTTEAQAAFSMDGKLMAYKQYADGTQSVEGTAVDSYDLVVSNADGSDPRVVATLPIAYWSGHDSFQWAPDSRSLLVNLQSTGELRLYDVEAPGEPRLLTKGATNIEFRPPHGDQILFRRLDMSGTGLYTMDLDGSNERALVVIPLGQTRGEADLDSAQWSPDGTQIIFTRTPEGLEGWQHMYVMNADGSDVRPLPIGEGTDNACCLTWSPDGTRIAFERYVSEPERMTIGVLTLATGQVIDVGPPICCDGAGFDWSPDGTAILAVPANDPRLIAIDPVDGSWRSIGPGVEIGDGVLNDFSPSWQRVPMP